MSITVNMKNVKKNQYIIFNTKPKNKIKDLNININNEPINRVMSCKFLGIIVDENISWKQHLNYITKKVAKSIGILCKTRKYLTKKSILNLYYSFVYPLLLYGNIIWGNCSKIHLDKLFKLQKLAIRLIV